MSPRPTGFVFHPDFLAHDTGRGHPERPERLRAILDHLDRSGRRAQLRETASDDGAPPTDALRWIEKVHAHEMVERVRTACDRAPAHLDPDTPVSRGSWAAALRAVSGTLAACDGVMDGTLRNAFCAPRPPGHHAESGRSMGFCLFDNAAVAARYLQEHHKCARILIVDWDVHHGNGTQEIFYDDPSVFYFSTHQHPFYPGTGARAERGAGRGVGATLNVPLRSGAGDAELIAAFRDELTPAARAFRPDFVLVSAGFDAHRDDPLAGLNATEAGFADLTRIVTDLADELCSGRLVSLLEGGYDLDALGRSVVAHVGALASAAE